MNSVRLLIAVSVLATASQAAVSVGEMEECRYKQKGYTFQEDNHCGQCTCQADIGLFASCESCGVIDITLTDNMKARGCEIVEADQSLSYPDCCGPTLVCPPETTTPESTKPEYKRLLDQLRDIIYNNKIPKSAINFLQNGH